MGHSLRATCCILAEMVNENCVSDSKGFHNECVNHFGAMGGEVACGLSVESRDYVAILLGRE